MTTCSFCGMDNKIREPIRAVPLAEFSCGTTIFTEKDIYQSEACKKIANLTEKLNAWRNLHHAQKQGGSVYLDEHLKTPYQKLKELGEL